MQLRFGLVWLYRKFIGYPEFLFFENPQLQIFFEPGGDVNASPTTWTVVTA